MKNFFHLFLIGFIVIHYVYSFRIVEKKHYRFRRCICLRIKPVCQCNNEQKLESESAIHQQQLSRQFYQEEPVTITSNIERNLTVSQPSSVAFSSLLSSNCIPTCLQGCMQNQYSRCQQSCQSTCKMEQSILIPIVESPKLIPQQQQELQQMMPESLPTQYQTWESNTQMDSAASVSEINSNTQISATVPVSSNSIGQFNVSNGQFSNVNNNICAQACMPSCQWQCGQQSASIIVPHSQHQLPSESIHQHQLLSESALQYQSLSESVPQHQLLSESVLQHQLLPKSVSQHQLLSESAPEHQLPPESVPQHQSLSDSLVQQPLIIKGSLQQQSVAYNNNMSNLNQTPCASFCMSPCPNQCIYQQVKLPDSYYSSPSPAITYSSLTVQLQPIASESVQQQSLKFENFATNEAQDVQHFSACLYICQNNCMQQCLQQDRSTEQCRISCNYACRNNCVQQQQQQQQRRQLPELTQSQELPQVIHQRSSQHFSRIQYPPSSPRIEQLQQIPNNKIFHEQYYRGNS